MSGGHFDYIDSRLKDEIFGYENKVKNVFEDREISELVFDVLGTFFCGMAERRTDGKNLSE